MAEIFGLGASAIAFIGLVGQFLQGCQYVYDFIDVVRDAPDHLRHYHTEISGFKSAVLGFQEVLQAIKPFVRIENSAEQALLALRSGSTAIEELKALLRKFEKSGERDSWKSIRVARKRSEPAKYVERLGEAKANILLAQSQVNLLLGLKHHGDRNQLQQTITSLSSSSASALLQTTQVQNSILDLRKSTSEKLDELTITTNILGERLDIFNVGLGSMVKAAISNAVRDVYEDLEETVKYKTLDKCRSSLGERAYSTYRQQRIPTTSNGHQLFNTNKRALRPVLYERTISLWFARITV